MHKPQINYSYPLGAINPNLKVINNITVMKEKERGCHTAHFSIILLLANGKPEDRVA